MLVCRNISNCKAIRVANAPADEIRCRNRGRQERAERNSAAEAVDQRACGLSRRRRAMRVCSVATILLLSSTLVPSFAQDEGEVCGAQPTPECSRAAGTRSPKVGTVA
jgi:hypothetical protein